MDPRRVGSRSRTAPSSGEGASPRGVPRLLVAALHSGAGKTMVTAGLIEALRSRGQRVAPYKCGPDFLDPQVLTVAAGGIPARNLDLWLTPRSRVREAFFYPGGRAGPSSVRVVEGVMGLFDTDCWGTSTLAVARLLDLPVILVVDGSRAVESVAASIRGAATLAGPGRIAGAVVNGVGRGWHANTIRRAIEERTSTPFLGTLPWDPSIRLPERHLGLATPRTDPGRQLGRSIRRAGSWASENLDMDRIEGIMEAAPPLDVPPQGVTPGGRKAPGGAVVAVARDPAFCFCYPESLEALERTARVEYFSPVRGDVLPAGSTALYLPGGYPELHAAELGRNEALRREVRAWVHDGHPTYAECGGMMYLMESLTLSDGKRFPMAGAVPGRTEMTSRLQGFGYAEARVIRKGLMGPRGTRIRGHLFHRSRRWVPDGTRWGFSIHRKAGGGVLRDGISGPGLLASYLHVRIDCQLPLVRSLAERGSQG